MKTLQSPTQRGQALIMIALAAIVLFAFAALAIDGGAVFSDRRHSQNASDTAAYAAALARVRGKADPAWRLEGLNRAASNGYTDGGVTQVLVYLCSEWPTAPENGSGESCNALPVGAKPDEYVYVRIKSVVTLFFARVIGWREVTNYTDAVVHAVPGDVGEWFDGKALVATKKGCPVAGDNYVPLVIGGNGTTIVNNSGIFVNSTCEPAIKDEGSSNVVTTTDGVCVVGGVPGEAGLPGDVDGVTPKPDDHCGSQIDINQYWMPDSDSPSLLAPYCAQPGSIDPKGGGVYEATPGYFNKTGNKSFPDVSPAGVLKLKKGVYCFYGGIDINAGWTVTTDLDGDGHDSNEGVFFYVVAGDVTFNGGAHIELYAMDNTAGGFDSRLLHYLIYVPPSNEADITISGNNGSTFTGTVLAPTSHVTLQGSGEAFDLHTQIIGYNTKITGDGYINITYDPDENAPAIRDGLVSGIE